MKSKKMILIMIIIFICIFLFLMFNFQYTYKEGILYSQNDLSEYNEKQLSNSELITRNKAIEIAKYITRDIIGIDITDGNPVMNVNIYKNINENETYNWNVTWSKNNFTEDCGVILNTNTGEILYLYARYNFNEKDTIIQHELSEKEIIDIIKPLTDYIKINVANYDMKILDIRDYYINGIKSTYQYCLFTNKKNNKKFFIKVNLKSKKIIEYGPSILEDRVNKISSSGRTA